MNGVRRFDIRLVEIHLHTGFAWLGCGSFVPKSYATRFLVQLGGADDTSSTAYTTELLPRSSLLVADMYFTIWSNYYVYQVGWTLRL